MLHRLVIGDRHERHHLSRRPRRGCDGGSELFRLPLSVAAKYCRTPLEYIPGLAPLRWSYHISVSPWNSRSGVSRPDETPSTMSAPEITSAPSDIGVMP